jgi:hypothetical protein
LLALVRHYSQSIVTSIIRNQQSRRTSPKSSLVVNRIAMSSEEANGAADAEINVKKENDEELAAVQVEGPTTDENEGVPDPTASKGGTEEQATAKSDGVVPAASNGDGDNSNAKDGGQQDAMYDEEDPMSDKTDHVAVSGGTVQSPSGSPPSGSGNKLLKELDDEAPKTFPQVVSQPS